MCFEAAASEMVNGSASWLDGALAAGELAEHPPARRVSERVEDGAEGRD